MTDWRDFDLALEESCAGLPPDEDMTRVRPWGNAFAWILWGLVLQTVKLPMGQLEILLPLLGTGLTLAGFRRLRSCGAGFRRCWRLTLVRMAWYAGALAGVEATPLWGVLRESWGYTALAALGAALTIAQTLALHLAMGELWRRQGADHASPVTYLLWFQAMALLSLVWPNLGPLLGWPALILFLFAVRRLWKGARELDQWGYGLTPAPARVPDWALAAGYFAAVLVLAAGAVYVSQQSTMDYAPVSLADTAPAGEIPRWVWEILPEEERALLEDAAWIDQDIYQDRTGWESVMLAVPTREHSAHIISAVRQPDKALFARQGGQILNPQAAPLSSRIDIGNEIWEHPMHFQGGAFYDWGGRTYAAPLSPGVREYTSATFFGSTTCRTIQMDWAYPLGAKSCRSYASFDLTIRSEPLVGVSFTRAVCWQSSPLVLPWAPTMDLLAAGETDAVRQNFFRPTLLRIKPYER